MYKLLNFWCFQIHSLERVSVASDDVHELFSFALVNKLALFEKRLGESQVLQLINHTLLHDLTLAAR